MRLLRLLRRLTFLDWMVVAALAVSVLALATGKVFALEPHSHWVMAIEKEDGAGQIGTFENEAACKAAIEYVQSDMPEVTLRSECIEIPLSVPIVREPEGDKT